ncbi:MAG: RluA family pseudouridine synthase [Proteobacteria bacterium]|nr:RluA family pseudouridine synthase [Pseudomonadota bacterium]
MSQHDVRRFEVEAGSEGQRLDVFLVEALGAAGVDCSRAGVQRWIKEGFVTRRNEERGSEERGVLEANPAKKTRVGEVFVVDLPEIKASELVAEDIPLEVVYEDGDLLVLNKPAGMTVHPAPGNFTGTLVQALLHHCGATLSGMNGEARPGIVHRIDKDTSGLLVVAKHDAAHRGLGKQFMRHDIHRVYLALVRGVPAPAVGRIEGAIGRHPVHRMRRAVVAKGGKDAVTHYKVLERFGEGAALVECKLETGRTHQIRVHMAHIGHPLLGDPMYGRPGALKGLGALELPKRQLLHAAELGFEHPMTGEWLEFTAEIPADIGGVLAVLRGQGQK